jgi:protein-tyrosine phosphatase
MPFLTSLSLTKSLSSVSPSLDLPSHSTSDDPTANLLDFTDEATAFLRHVEEVKGRVLIHCVAGVSRSVSFVLLHLMATHRVPLKIAYQYIKTARSMPLLSLFSQSSQPLHPSQ